MDTLLINAGLTETQAAVYSLLLEKGQLTPPAIAKMLRLTRSNAYKVLEQLMTYNLATREERRKKFVYSAGDPQALINILALERNKLLAKEKAVNASLSLLRERYQAQATRIDTKALHGRTKVKRLYEHQAEQRQPIYFIKSRADIPTLSYETMHEVRSLATRYNVQRFGITPDVPEAPSNPAIDRKNNLTRTWIDEESYTAPVEWSVSGDEVTIFVFEEDGSAVLIKNSAIADSLRQLWQLLDRQLRSNPNYISYPRKAKRNI